MSATPESRVKAAVCKILDTYKPAVYYFKPAANGYGRVGIPDIIVCANGRFVGIECKAGAAVPTTLQQRELLAVTEAGGRAVVVNENSMHELRAIMQHLMGRNDND